MLLLRLRPAAPLHRAKPRRRVQNFAKWLNFPRPGPRLRPAASRMLTPLISGRSVAAVTDGRTGATEAPPIPRRLAAAGRRGASPPDDPNVSRDRDPAVPGAFPMAIKMHSARHLVGYARRYKPLLFATLTMGVLGFAVTFVFPWLI